MPIKIKSIEYTEAGVNILGDEVEIVTLQDGSTREIKLRGYAAPMGINDFGGDQDLARQKIAEHIAKVTGQAVASPIAEVAVLQAERDAERAAKLVALQERDARQAELESERAARQLAEAQKEAALAEVREVKLREASIRPALPDRV